jgi:anthranilate phosphoribosyltransferase
MTPANSYSWGALFTDLAQPDQQVDSAAIAWAMTEILQERATEAQTAAFMFGLKVRGESAAEVGSLAAVMLAHANVVPTSHGHQVVLDIVGTGGDGSHSVNISTMAAIVAAACGTPVIKHGNRAVSSSTGAADVLEELGVVIDLDADQVAQVARNAGIAFCFAPRHHPAMRFAAPARKQLGIPTVFNILGPLTNPAQANAGLIGCANADLAPVMAQVLLDRGVNAMVVRGDDGLDEISLSAPTRIWDVTSGQLVESVVTPADFGVMDFDPENLRGGDRERNAELARKVLGGEPAEADAIKVAAIRQSVAINAAAALAIADSVTNSNNAQSVAQRINQFLPLTEKTLNDGSAWQLLQRWIQVTESIAIDS